MQTPPDFLKDLSLRLQVEIDHDIANEDDIEER